ncbi:MAG TPA: ABC transporter substrate-binding protein [Terriglobales bacterium]
MSFFSKPDEFTPQRVVSLQPSITVILDRLGLLERVVACTKYCAEVCPTITESGSRIIQDAWSAKAEEIVAAKPDLVIASVPYRMESVGEILKVGAQFLGLAPKKLRDIYADISSIAGIMNVADRGRALVREMQMEIGRVQGRNASRIERPSVYCEEWGKPLIHSQAWVAELVEAAGGRFLGEAGKRTEPDIIAAADPDVILAAWCGAGNRVPLERIIQQRGWEKLRAVREGRVFCINDEYLNTPAPTLLLGLHAIEAALGNGEETDGLRRIQLNHAIGG